jgi:hypothetical protein
MARVMIKLFTDTSVASTISSIAVSGSMTRVKVVPAGIVTPPSRDVPEITVMLVDAGVIALTNVLCWEREEYFLVGIQVPIGYSEFVADIDFA